MVNHPTAQEQIKERQERRAKASRAMGHRPGEKDHEEGEEHDDRDHDLRFQQPRPVLDELARRQIVPSVKARVR